MSGRGRLALVALLVLVIYLVGYAVKVAEDNRGLQEANRAAIAELAASQQNAVDVLAKILAQAEAAEQAGLAEEGTVEAILKRVEGLDPEIISRAVEEAARRVGGPAAASGPPGPPGPPGRDAPVPSTTSTAPAATTSTTRPPTTTTSATTTTSSTTSTTRPCVVGLLGICALR